MWRVIVLTIVVLILFGAWTFLWFILGGMTQERAAKRDGMAGLGGAQLLKSGAEVLRELGTPQDDFTDFLSEKSSNRVRDWLSTYDKWREKK